MAWCELKTTAQLLNLTTTWGCISVLTFLCLASMAPSGPKEVEVLYSFPSESLSGIDPPMM